MIFGMLQPRYVGPSPKALLVTGALVLSAIFGTYAVMKSDDAPQPAPSAQVEKAPVPQPPAPPK